MGSVAAALPPLDMSDAWADALQPLPFCWGRIHGRHPANQELEDAAAGAAAAASELDASARTGARPPVTESMDDRRSRKDALRTTDAGATVASLQRMVAVTVDPARPNLSAFDRMFCRRSQMQQAAIGTENDSVCGEEQRQEVTLQPQSENELGPALSVSRRTD